MSAVLKYLPVRNTLVSRLAAGNSVFVTAPRNFGLRDLCRNIASVVAPPGELDVVNLDSRQDSHVKRLDFGRIWRSCSIQIDHRELKDCSDQSMFVENCLGLLKSSNKGIFVLIEGAKRGNEANHLELLSAFRKILIEGRNLRRGLRVLAIDDWSTFHHCTSTEAKSELDYYVKERIRFLELFDVVTCIKANSKPYLRPRIERLNVMAAAILDVTGGHAGLVNEIMLALNRCQWQLDISTFRDQCRWFLRDCSVITDILSVLQENATALSDTALKYQTPSIPPENSPRTDILVEYGVLRQVGYSLCLQMCPGVITDIVFDVARAPKQTNPPLGSVYSETGISAYQGTQFTPNDDDFVVLHLSDLHINALRYRFRLALPDQTINPNQPTLEELILADLDSLKLIGRIDAVIFTGDFVWEGKDNKEFKRAREVIESLLRGMRVPLDRALFIPGNHDVEWDPSTLAALERTKVSNENYGDFISQMKKEWEDGLSTLFLTSVSGDYRLLVLGLDTNGVEGPDAPGIGFVRNVTMCKALEILRNKVKGPISDEQRTFTWLALHHHVFPATSPPFESAKTGNVSMFANAAGLLKLAGEIRAEIILHGHEHQPSITVASRWPLDDENKRFSRVVSVGAGSVGVKQQYLGPIGKNHYYIIVRRPEDAIIRSRCLGDTALRFSCHNDLLVTFPGES
jgi:calcineurin-like phosphoesterase family protein